MEYYTRFTEQCQDVLEQYPKIYGIKGRNFSSKNFVKTVRCPKIWTFDRCYF